MIGTVGRRMERTTVVREVQDRTHLQGARKRLREHRSEGERNLTITNNVKFVQLLRSGRRG